MWPCTVRLTELPLPFHPLVPQVDWDLASVGAPGVTVNIAFKGQVNYNFKTGCWGMKLEASLGVSFGIDVMGVKVGIGIGVIGTLNLFEVTVGGQGRERETP